MTSAAIRIPLLLAACVIGFFFIDSSAFVPTSNTGTHRYPTVPEVSIRHVTELNLFGLRSDAKQLVNGQANGKININGYVNGNTKAVPFVVERLSLRPSDDVFKGIAEMCISVFFNDGKTGRAMPPWKEVQLSYLRMIQMADLRRRRQRDQKTNAMYVAYRVEEASPNAAQSQPLILNMRDIHNINALQQQKSNDVDYVRSEILGFCEVSMVPFGLIPATSKIHVPALERGYLYDDEDDHNNNSNNNNQIMVPKRVRRADAVARPVLTNLSVKRSARSSGVGSKLLEACERTAAGEWGKTEVVLEVEDDNQAARKWYQQRGYRVLFSDPTSRRYDVSGLLLKKVACTRQIMRKAVNNSSRRMAPSSSSSSSASDDSKLSLENVFRRLRETVLQ
ncbi:expressed unknown protein [Seminavis robusta]|uniref:N-acetyltransferase domain-containing protein n=1 Tax=Seminavis robusta TaxID=568900 RepID=A0A9N8HPB7_9STRA|nr:expressed unknown protein [Seminavis robusta]|eukprot:Sro1165_g248150.1 n/a (393) ;mRNA; f:27448-28876